MAKLLKWKAEFLFSNNKLNYVSVKIDSYEWVKTVIVYVLIYFFRYFLWVLELGGSFKK